MLTKLLNIPRRYAQLAALRLMLALLVLMTLGILTLFMAVMMVCQWHWQLDCTCLLCLLPWCIGSIILWVVLAVSARRLKREKDALVVFKIASLLWIYLLKIRA